MSINFFDNYKVTLNSFVVHTPAAKAGGHSLIWSKPLCAREQGMVLGPPGSYSVCKTKRIRVINDFFLALNRVAK